MADIRLLNVTKSYGKHRVVEGFTIEIRDGECFTFLGPSGCGKTVVLRMIAGFEQPDEGEIFIGERLVSAPARRHYIPPEERRIGVVFQDYAVWPHKTVLENVIYPLTIQKVAKEEASERALKTIAMVNLGGLEHRMPFQLSGGQQQRVALARALVSRPDVMLLDEPLSNLDANLREEMRFEIKELQKNTGVTILYVTHDQEVALAISDRSRSWGRTDASARSARLMKSMSSRSIRLYSGLWGFRIFCPLRNGKAGFLCGKALRRSIIPFRQGGKKRSGRAGLLPAAGRSISS